jgi:Mrp family chromosome partitioning ATPase
MRRTPSTTSRRPAASRGPIQLADSTPTDGRLVLTTETGEVVHEAASPVAESLRYMMGRLRLGDGTDLPERLGITSSIGGEGVTFVARSLALVVANDTGRRVCLVDLNWWAPEPWPGDDGSQPGLADVIRDGLPLDNALIPTGTPGLSFLPPGQAAVAERPLLANSTELDKALVELSETFDHVLIDLPAIRSTSEALRLAESCRSVAVVVTQGVTPEDEVKAVVDELHAINLLGVILNRNSTKIPRVLRRRIPGASSPPG